MILCARGTRDQVHRARNTENNRWLGWKRITQNITHFRWKIKWRLEYLGALGIVGETVPLGWFQYSFVVVKQSSSI